MTGSSLTAAPILDWPLVSLGDVATLIRGVTYKKEQSSLEERPGLVPLLRATNIERELDFEDLVYVPDEVVSAEQRLQVGDLVVTASSGSLSVVGKAARLRSSWRGTFGAFCFALRPNPRFIEPSYLSYFLQSSEYRARVSKLAAGVNINNLRREHIESFPFPLAPTVYQRRTSDQLDRYLSTLDAAAEGLKRVQANVRRYRASVLKAAVEGRLVPTEAELARREGRDYEPASILFERILAERRRRWEEAEFEKLKAKGASPQDDRWKAKYQEPARPDTSELPALPDGWCWATVSTVGDVLLGRQRAPQYLTGRWSRPYLRVANVKDDRLDFSDVEEMDFDPVHYEKYRLCDGDILVSEGQSPHLVGQSAIYRGGIDGLCFQKTLHRFRPIAGGPSSQFAQVVFRAHVMTGVFLRLASITTNIAHLTLEKFEGSRFPLPPAAEQIRIADEVARHMSIADEVAVAANRDLTRSAQLRQSILKWAFEGKLVDQDPNDEPASVLLERIRAERAATAEKKSKPRQLRKTRKVAAE